MISPMGHQLDAVPWCHGRKAALFHEPGCGKTIATLLTLEDEPMPTLVAAPPAVVRAAWAADTQHFPGLDVRIYHGTPNQRQKAMSRVLGGGDDLVIVTSLDMMRRAEVRDLCQKLNVRRLVIDESSRIKNHEAKTTRAAVALADRMERVTLLSGTPAPNGPHEYWGQVRAIDPQQEHVRDYYRWCNHWMYPVRKKRTVKGRTHEYIATWNLRPEREDEFAAMLRERCWFLAKKDCVDLPTTRDQVIVFDLEPAERRAYDRMVHDLKLDDDRIDPVAVLGKLRQLASGAAYTPGGGGGNVQRYGESRTRTMVDVARTIFPRPLVVWAEHTFEIDDIFMALTQDGWLVNILDGRGSAKSKQEKIEDFQHGDLNALVCHPAAVAHGITLTAASHAIFYSMGFSAELHQQARDRIHRVGQDAKCTYYYLEAVDTIDAAVRYVVKRKQSGASAILDELRRTA